MLFHRASHHASRYSACSSIFLVRCTQTSITTGGWTPTVKMVCRVWGQPDFRRLIHCSWLRQKRNAVVLVSEQQVTAFLSHFRSPHPNTETVVCRTSSTHAVKSSKRPKLLWHQLPDADARLIMATEEPPEGLRRRKTGLTQGDEKAKDRTTALLSAAPNQVSAVLEKAGPAIQAVIYVMKIVVVR